MAEGQVRGSRSASAWVAHGIADGFVLAVLVLWWLASAALPDYIVPSPQSVGMAFIDLFTDARAAQHTLASIWRVLVSVLIATLLGSALALSPFYFPWTTQIVHARIQPMLNAFPSLGWALMAVIWFDASSAVVIFIQVMILLRFTLINVREGVAALDWELLEMGLSLTRSEGRLFTRLILPQLTPYLIAALRMSYGVAWKIALIAEVFGARDGLGRLMFDAQQSANLPVVFATCLAVVALFLAGERCVIDPFWRKYGAAAPPG